MARNTPRKNPSSRQGKPATVRPGSRLTLPAPRDFHFAATVTSYGYCALKPNQWDQAAATLHSALRDASGQLVSVQITCDGAAHRLSIRCDRLLDRRDATLVKRQVRRMLRLDQDVATFWARHPQACAKRFGRLIRSATLFEDMVRTITSCNVAWANTKTMNQRLCEHVGEGGFPLPSQLAKLTPARLKQLCKVGYRAPWIIELARAFDDGAIDPAKLESPDRTTDELFGEIRKLSGFGPYATANVLMCLGRFDHVPIDSEAYRLWRNRTGDTTASPTAMDRAIREHYAQYRPWDFLAYWFDLWHDGA